MSQVAVRPYIRQQQAQGGRVHPGAAAVETSHDALSDLARNLAPALGRLGEIEVQQRQAQESCLYADVMTEARKRTMELEHALSQDTDYGSHRQRFEGGVTEIDKWAQDELKGTSQQYRHQFKREYGLLSAQHGFNVRTAAARGLNQQMEARLDARMEAAKNGYGLNSLQNEAALAQVEADIVSNVNAGAISPVAAQAKLQRARQDAVIQYHAVLRENDPEAALFEEKMHLAGRGVGSDLALAAYNESGRAGSMAIGYDRNGGTSYGKYQISSGAGTFDGWLKYLEQNGKADMAESFRRAGRANTGGTDGAVPELWKQYVADKKITDAMQDDFIRKTHIQPALEKLPEGLRSAISQDKRLAAMLGDTAVQHGPQGAVRILSAAWNESGGDVDTFIAKTFSARGGEFASSDAGVRNSVINRLRKSRDMLLGNGPLSATEWAAEANKSEAEIVHRQTLARQKSAELIGSMDDLLTTAVKTGDFSPYRQAEQQLRAQGLTKEADKAAETRGVYERAQPMLEAASPLPIQEKEAAARQLFARMYKETPEKGKTIAQVESLTLNALEEQKKAFLKDPAAYAAMQQQATSELDAPGAPQRKTVEETTLERMNIQRQAGRGIPGFIPKALTADQVTEYKGRLESDDVPLKDKTDLAKELAAAYGGFAGQVFRELELPGDIQAAVSLAMEAPSEEALSREMMAVSAIPDKDIPKIAGITSAEAQDIALQNEEIAFQSAFAAFLPGDSRQQSIARDMRKLGEKFALMGKAETLQGLAKPYDYEMNDAMLLRLPRSLGLNIGEVEYGLLQLMNNFPQLLHESYSEQNVNSIRQRGRWLSTADDKISFMADGLVVLGRNGQALTVTPAEVIRRVQNPSLLPGDDDLMPDELYETALSGDVADGVRQALIDAKVQRLNQLPVYDDEETDMSVGSMPDISGGF